MDGGNQKGDEKVRVTFEHWGEGMLQQPGGDGKMLWTPINWLPYDLQYQDGWKLHSE
jgi:hypothetical protein